MQICDAHTHTWFSFDGHSNLSELCQQAVSRGVSVLAMTEHYDFDHRGCREGYALREQQRLAEFCRIKQVYEGRLRLLYGIELGQPHVMPEAAKDFLSQREFDVVIGSLHDLRPERDLYTGFDYSTLSACDAVYAQFFEECCELLDTGLVDVIGHYDYPLRRMQQMVPDASMRRWRDQMQPFLKALAHSGVALELNTSGVRRWQKRPAGEDWLLRDYRRYGGERISVGSDAHGAEDVASGIPQVYEILRQSGFDKITVFEHRVPHYVYFDR